MSNRALAKRIADNAPAEPLSDEEEGLAEDAEASRGGRVWLLAFLLVGALVAIGWSAAWFAARSIAMRELDAWIANEAAAGRRWTCADRAVSGYPLRMQVSCRALGLERLNMRIALGPASAVAEVYDPRLIVLRVEGPLRASDGRVTIEGNWRAFAANYRAAQDGFHRASAVMDGPAFSIRGLSPAPVNLAGERLETHLRPNLSRAISEGAYDWVARLTQGRLPGMDTFLGGDEPTDIDVQLTATQAHDFAARPVPEELERWRKAGGKIEVSTLSVTKGARRLDTRGQVALDRTRRPVGRFDIAVANVEGLLGDVIVTAEGPGGVILGAPAGILGALTGGRIGAPSLNNRPARPPPGTNLKPLPPLRIQNGALFLGTLPVPGVLIDPLY
jgi:hypothetical protein